MCYKGKADNETYGGLMAKTSNVTWRIDGELLQAYFEPLAAEIHCICIENQTIASFDKMNIITPVNFYNIKN